MDCKAGCWTKKMIMGSNTKDSDGNIPQGRIPEHSDSKLVDSDERNILTDPESVIQFTRTPKKLPQYKPRSRKLEDLPGGIRVPIIQRESSRVKPRLDAGREGLQELKSLREAQQQLISDATKTYQREHEQVRTNRFHKSFSTSILSCITEENNNTKQSEDTHFTSSLQAKDSSLTSTHGNRNVESKHRAVDRTPLIAFPGPSVGGRRASIQVDSDYFKQCANASASLSRSQPENDPPPNSRLRSRRPSFQVDSIITDRSHTISTAQLISEMKLQYNLPGPLRAVMRQYGSSSALNTKETKEDNGSEKRSINPPEKKFHRSEYVPTQIRPDENVPPKELSPQPNKQVPKLERNHSRGGSSTSDYFGSLENMAPQMYKGSSSPAVSDTGRRKSFSDFGQDSVLEKPSIQCSSISLKKFVRDDVLESRSSVSEYSDEGFNADDILESPNDAITVQSSTHNSFATVSETRNIESVRHVTSSRSAKSAVSLKTKSLLETAL